MNHSVHPHAEIEHRMATVARSTVIVALVLFAAWVALYAIVAASGTLVAGTALSVGDSSFVVSVLVVAVLAAVSRRWVR